MPEEIVKATIESAKIRKISDIFGSLHKPKGLTFADTDAIILKLRVGGKIITETFYCCISADGTLNTSVISKEAQRRQGRLAQFISRFISKKPKYNIREEIAGWEGREIEMVKQGEYYLLI